MPKDVLYGKTLRKSFARTQEIREMPNLLEIQKSSYKWFLETGLREVFKAPQVSTSFNMFYNCKKLKGEEEWTKGKATDKTYAKTAGGER